MRWIGHVCFMEDCRIPKDILYGELAIGKLPRGNPADVQGRVQTRYENFGNLSRELGRHCGRPQQLALPPP